MVLLPLPLVAEDANLKDVVRVETKEKADTTRDALSADAKANDVTQEDVAQDTVETVVQIKNPEDVVKL